MFPNLESLSLIGNRISDPTQLAPLSACQSLRRLYLLQNPVSEKPDFRLRVAGMIPHLRVLDFQRVTEQERTEGRRLFGTLPLLTDATAGLSKRDKLRLLIEKSRSLEELRRLELLLKVGDVSEDLLDQRLREIGHN